MKGLKVNSPDVIADDTGDDLVLINLRTGLYYRFANDSRALLLQHANLDSSDDSNGKNDEDNVEGGVRVPGFVAAKTSNNESGEETGGGNEEETGGQWVC